MKLDDIPFVVDDINKQMPLFTNNFYKMPHSFSQHLPKNVRETSLVLNEKFLDNNLAKIEEILYSLPGNKIPEWIKEYQVRMFSANLGHDSFFKNAISFDAKTKHHLSIKDVALVGSLKTKTKGADIILGDQSLHAQFGGNSLYGFKTGAVAVVGTYFDRMAVDCFDSTGNLKMACYEDNAGSAGNKISGDTISAPLDSAFTWRSLTEFQVTKTTLWLASVTDGSGFFYYKNTGVSGNSNLDSAFIYSNPLDNPFSATSVNVYLQHIKVGHS